MIINDFKIEILTDWHEINQVLLLFNTSFPRSLTERIGDLENYARKLAENAVVYVISLEDEATGFAACYCNDLLTKLAYLAQIAVHHAHRGQHIGGMLLELCIQKSRQMGMEKLILEVDDDNVAAHKLYAKYEFRYAQKASENSHFFEKVL